MKEIVHVDQATIRRNVKHGEDEPAIIVRTYKASKRVFEHELAPGVKIVQKMREPLACGARIWIEREV